jgi:hypothetical protein
MSMRWISSVPLKVLKILAVEQFQQVSGLVDLWYQHGSSTPSPR